MKQLVLFAILICLYSTSVFSQNIGIQGVVYDSIAGKVLQGANLQIIETGNIEVSNKAGRYFFPDLSKGTTYTIIASYTGYASKQKIITLEEKTPTVHFKLQEVSTPLDEVVVTGTGTVHHIQAVPLMTEVIGKKFLSMYSGQSIEAILAGLSPSFDFNKNNMGSNIQMNGLGNQYILILINGERIHGDVGGQNILGLINPTDIEKVEIVKGASSSLYGSDAIAGVINIITQKEKAKIALQNNSRIASYGSIQQSNKVSLAKGKWRSTTLFNLKHSDGWQNTKQEWFRKRIFYNSVTKTANEFTDYKISERIDFKANKKFSANIEGNYYQKEIKRPSGEPQYVTFGMSYKSQSYAARAKYQYNNKTYFTLNSSYNQTRYFHDFTHITEKEHVLQDGTIVHPVYYPGDQFQVNKQERFFSHAKSVFELTEKQTISAGVEFEKSGLTAPFRLLSQKESDFSLSAYLQDEYNISDDLNITGGLRLLKHEKFGWHCTPKISLLKKWANFNLRGTWSQGFKTPSIKELHYHYERTMMSKLRLYLGNEDLKPETSNYYSIAAEYQSSQFSLSISTYLNKLKDMISLREIPTAYADKIRDIDKTMQYKNIEDATTKGVELTAKCRLKHKIKLGASYSYLDAKGHFLNQDNEIEKMTINGTAHHRANLYALWEHPWETYTLGIGLFGKGQSKRYYKEYGNADGYTTFRLNTQHKLFTTKPYNLEINTGIDNIFDYKETKPYGYNYATKTPGRVFYISLIIHYKKY